MINYKNVKWTYDDLKKISYLFSNYKKGKSKYRECQNIITFDIETSNGWTNGFNTIGFDHRLAAIKDDNGKTEYDKRTAVSVMYVWQCAIESPGEINVFMGRTWEEFKLFFDKLVRNILLASAGLRPDIYNDNLITFAKKKIPNLEMHIYIHNLGFEFQHLRNVFEDEFKKYSQSVFARSMRKPMKSKIRYCGCNVIFNDTLCLTHTSLENWTKSLAVKKLKEVVDDDYYNVIRTPETKLTNDEINYSVNDVVSMVYGMMEYRKKYTHLHEIPMTQTGEVRRVCFKEIARANMEWAAKCVEITNKTSFDFYLELRKAFLGGWTHANCKFANKKLENLRCFDFTSSYPAVMCSRTFPTDEFIKCDVTELDALNKQPLDNMQYHYLVDVSFYGVKSKTWNTFWSSSKTEELDGEEKDNGKIVCCKMMRTTMTDLDYRRFVEVYSTDKIEIHNLWKAKAGYLPKEFVEVILKYFGNKTTLKGIDGREEDYTIAKQFVNGIYGDCVKKIIDDVIAFTDGWTKTAATVSDYKKIVENAKAEKTYTTYQIGVWVTAWARHNLWDAIIKFDDKVVYCDTDSVKGMFDDDDMKWFEEYNKQIDKYSQKVAAYHNMDPKLWKPLKPNGKPSELGYFDRDPDCVEFKTLGAKRYCYKTADGKLHTTIAGLSKAVGEELFKSVDDFKYDVYIPTSKSKKLITKYNDNQSIVEWVDRDGNKYCSIDRYGICLEPTTFEMSAEDYKVFLEMLNDGQLNDYFDTPEILR